MALLHTLVITFLMQQTWCVMKHVSIVPNTLAVLRDQLVLVLTLSCLLMYGIPQSDFTSIATPYTEHPQIFTTGTDGDVAVSPD